MTQDISGDRELLEFAARAAELSAYVYVGPEGLMEWVNETNDREGYFPNPVQWWNPIRSDGDALRLAVTLNLAVVLHPTLNQALVRPYHTRDMNRECREDCEKHADHFAATRRAIVRAAAEIGKGIPQQQPAAEWFPEDNYYKTQSEAEERGRAAAEIGKQMECGAAA